MPDFAVAISFTRRAAIFPVSSGSSANRRLSLDRTVGLRPGAGRGSPGLNTKLVVHSDPEPLLAADVTFRGLH